MLLPAAAEVASDPLVPSSSLLHSTLSHLKGIIFSASDELSPLVEQESLPLGKGSVWLHGSSSSPPTLSALSSDSHTLATPSYTSQLLMVSLHISMLALKGRISKSWNEAGWINSIFVLRRYITCYLIINTLKSQFSVFLLIGALP